MLVPFSTLPKSARIWIYQASRAMNHQEQTLLHNGLEQFISTWTAHQAGLKGSATILHDIFVVIAVDEGHNHASGCSIDKSVHFMKQASTQTGIDFFDRMTAVCQNPDGSFVFVKGQSVNDFLESGQLSKDAKLFNNLLTDLQSLESSWSVPLASSWLANFIRNTESSPSK